MSPSTRKTAVVLAGAVANGAFEAGALEVVAQRRLSIRSVLGTSAGALNAALFARYVIAGDQEAGAAALVRLWTEEASWWRVLRPSVRGILTLTGLSGQDGVLDLLRRNVRPVASPGCEAELRLVVTALKGQTGAIGGAPATTHEGVLAYGPRDFATPDRLEDILRAAVASSAFPGAFVPASVPRFGQCSDGGIVNNTPVKNVLAEEIERVVVIVPSPRMSHEHAPADIGALVGRIADVIVQERLYRDLREAYQVNERLAALEKLGPRLGRELLDEVKAATGLAGARRLDIVEIRPRKVPPNPFAGFFSRRLREELIELGRDAAREALRDVPRPSAASSPPLAVARE